MQLSLYWGYVTAKRELTLLGENSDLSLLGNTVTIYLKQTSYGMVNQNIEKSDQKDQFECYGKTKMEVFGHFHFVKFNEPQHKDLYQDDLDKMRTRYHIEFQVE